MKRVDFQTGRRPAVGIFVKCPMPPPVVVRADLFDHMMSISVTMDQKRIEFVTDCQAAFPAQFPSFEDAARYVNSLDTKATAELFCEMARFYRVSKQNVTIEVLQLTMILTIIERIQSHGREFVALYDYLSRQNVAPLVTGPIASVNELMRLLETIKQNYSAAHGATRGVVDFFQTYASDADKILLAKSMKTQDAEHLVGSSSRVDPRLAGAATFAAAVALGFPSHQGNLPRCYNWKNCYIEYGDCHPDVGCDLTTDAPKMALTIKKLVQLLYAWRSKFDHDAKIPPISDAPFIAETADGLIVNDLTIDLFRGIFERTFKAYFDRHVAPAGPVAAPAAPAAAPMAQAAAPAASAAVPAPTPPGASPSA